MCVDGDPNDLDCVLGRDSLLVEKWAIARVGVGVGGAGSFLNEAGDFSLGKPVVEPGKICLRRLDVETPLQFINCNGWEGCSLEQSVVVPVSGVDHPRWCRYRYCWAAL